MHILHVRSVPDELYDHIRSLASAEHRSISAQVVVLLNRGIEAEMRRAEQAELLSDIRRQRFTPPADASDVGNLLREAEDVWVDIDQLAVEIGAAWADDDVSAVDAVREQRRSL